MKYESYSPKVNMFLNFWKDSKNCCLKWYDKDLCEVLKIHSTTLNILELSNKLNRGIVTNFSLLKLSSYDFKKLQPPLINDVIVRIFFLAQ